MNLSCRQGGINTIAAVLALSITGGCSNTASEAGDEVRQWDLSIYVGVNDPIAERARAFADQVYEDSDQRLEITVRPAGELPFETDEILRRVGDNSVTMGDANGSFVSGDCQIATAGFLPLLVRTIDEWTVAWDELETPTQDCFESFGARALVSYSYPPQSIWGRGDTPESCTNLDGLTIRQTGPASGVFLSELGAEPVTLSTSEVPDALGRGVIDAAVTSGTSVVGNGWSVDYGCLLDFATAPSFILVNIEELDALPDDLSQAVTDAAAEFESALISDLDDIENESRATLAENGVDLVEVPPGQLDSFIPVMQSYWNDWADDAGPEARQALDGVRTALDRGSR